MTRASVWVVDGGFSVVLHYFAWQVSRVYIAPRDKREMGRGVRKGPMGCQRSQTWTGTPGTGSGGQVFLIFLIDILFYITVYVLGCKFARAGHWKVPHAFISSFLFCILKFRSGCTFLGWHQG